MEKQEPGSSQQSLLIGQEAMGTNEKPQIPSEHKKTLLLHILQRRFLLSGTSDPASGDLRLHTPSVMDCSSDPSWTWDRDLCSAQGDAVPWHPGPRQCSGSSQLGLVPEGPWRGSPVALPAPADPGIQGPQLLFALLTSAGTCSNLHLVKATFSKIQVFPNTSQKEKASARRSPLPSQADILEIRPQQQPSLMQFLTGSSHSSFKTPLQLR
ncbi:hypothetical protein QYF61_022689 [Mycteria americana]|uniref:Uncharacterized protein n=1 Tax=Mycteria americana TaxID=33587 RepID=A0AAN7S4A5_MYCAM|nr:hypothetical protein QYF61_022689 [Mycteria americana]